MKQNLKSAIEQAREIDTRKKALESKAQVRFRNIFNNIADDVAHLLLTGNVDPKEVANNYKPDFIGALRETYREVIRTFGFSLRESTGKKCNVNFSIKKEKEKLDLEIKQTEEIEITENQEQEINKEFFASATLFINNRSETQADIISQTNEKEITSNISKSTSEYNLLLADNISKQQETNDKLNKITLAIVLGTATEKDRKKLVSELEKFQLQEENLRTNRNLIISRNFKDNFSKRGKVRSEIISEFEVGQTESFIRYEEAKILDDRIMVGLAVNVVKNWVSMEDNKVRPAHAQANATYHFNPIPVNDFFLVGGERLKYPRDPNGSASNIINCRCISIYSISDK